MLKFHKMNFFLVLLLSSSRCSRSNSSSRIQYPKCNKTFFYLKIIKDLFGEAHSKLLRTHTTKIKKTFFSPSSLAQLLDAFS